jgi:hypothetical protein
MDAFRQSRSWIHAAGIVAVKTIRLAVYF